MNYHRIKQRVFVPLLVLPALLINAASVSAQDTVINTSILNEANQIAGEAFSSAAESHIRIVQLSDASDEIINEFGTESKLVDGLEIYNAGLRRTISEQEKTIAEYDVAIGEAAELQRQIAPLMMRMMDALEQFVDLDLPFQLDSRKERLATVRASFDQSNVNIAAKFSAVLQAYQAENNSGRSLDAYTSVLPINGVDRDVDILKVGRVGLYYQTSDSSSTGVWNKATGQWDELGAEYRRPVREGIRMARQETQIEILDLPIAAPE